MQYRPVVVVENDPFPRLLQAFLDADDVPQRTSAIADFVAHDIPDYAGWLKQARARAAGLYPADVRLVETQDELRASLEHADAVVAESLAVGPEELALAGRLRAVHKYGTVLRNIDTAACAARGVEVLTVRRRTNIACAEHAFALLLALSRKLVALDGRISFEQLRAAGYAPGRYDTQHTPNSNWARVGGLRTLHGSTAGILGLGEIGREIAVRASAFGMEVIYHQRTRVPSSEESAFRARYCPLDELLARSDAVFVALPLNASTRGLIDGARLAQMKPDALLVNVSRAAIVERGALLEALSSRQLGGLGLDTFYEEPGRADDPLLALDNAIVTPRIAAQPRSNALTDLADVMANLARVLAADRYRSRHDASR